MPAESAVEPTRSENITVTWRRSAVSGVFGSANGGCGEIGAAPESSAISRNIFRRCPSETPKLFEVLIGQVAKDGGVDVALDKALRVLGHAELFEPVLNLPHRGLSRVMRRFELAYRSRCAALQSRSVW
jgi:hypothetical protein